MHEVCLWAPEAKNLCEAAVPLGLTWERLLSGSGVLGQNLCLCLCNPVDLCCWRALTTIHRSLLSPPVSTFLRVSTREALGVAT